jgi:hypothetical protein
MLLCLFLLMPFPALEDQAVMEAKVVEFCVKRKGEQVGDGLCAAMAVAALKQAGFKQRGMDHPNPDDYTWGKLIFTLTAQLGAPKATGQYGNIAPGYVVQFREARFVGTVGLKKTTMTYPHHTAIVEKVDRGGKVLHILHQNVDGKKTVVSSTLVLNNLTEGWIRIYEPVKAEKKNKQ